MGKSPELKTSGRNSEEIRLLAAGINVAGGVLGCVLLEGVAIELFKNTSLTGFQKHVFIQLADLPGVTIFGLAIPGEIYRRTYHKSWTDIWRRIIR